MAIRKKSTKRGRIKKANHGKRPISGKKFSTIKGIGKK